MDIFHFHILCAIYYSVVHIISSTRIIPNLDLCRSTIFKKIILLYHNNNKEYLFFYEENYLANELTSESSLNCHFYAFPFFIHNLICLCHLKNDFFKPDRFIAEKSWFIVFENTQRHFLCAVDIEGIFKPQL